MWPRPAFSVPGLRKLLALLFCLHVASACIQCDRRVRKMVDDYIVHTKDEEEQGRYNDARDTAYKEYLNWAARISDGVIDPTTLYKVTTEFQNEFRQFASKETTTWHDFIRMMSNKGGERILKKHLEAFVGERGGVCPNECGLLHRKVKRCRMDGGVCPNELQDCSKQLDCGERVVRATEDDQVVLDCFLPWHSLVAAVGGSGRKEYRYSWAEGTHAPAESDFKPLLVTEESGMVLNQVLLEQWGTYRCELLLSGTTTTLVSRFTFRLHVAPAPPPQTLRPPLALPTLPPGPAPSKPLLHTVCVVVTTVCLSGSVAVTVFLGAMMRRHARRLAGED